DHVLTALEHDLEVPARDRLLPPPAVEDTPLLANRRDRLAVHPRGGPVERLLDERRPRLVQPLGASGDTGDPVVFPLISSFTRSTTGSTGGQARPGRRKHLDCLFEHHQSRGTSSERCSGSRDHGATSTTVATAPAPALARTWRRLSCRRDRSSSPSGRTSAS